MKARFRDFLLIIAPPLQCLIAGLGAVALCSPVAIVFYNMKALGIFWLPILCAYALLLGMALRQIVRLRELEDERGMYGDELFFEVYPRMKRLEERKLRFRARLSRLRGETENRKRS